MHWRLTDAEWKALEHLLAAPAPGQQGGRPRNDNRRAAAEMALVHLYQTYAATYSSFGWNSPHGEEKFDVSAATANRRYREWVANGQWQAFYAALAALRTAASPRPRPPVYRPVSVTLAALENAYGYLAGQLFPDLPPVAVTISIGCQKGGRLGFFLPDCFRAADLVVHNITIAVQALRGKAAALGTLIHEMVHLLNYTRQLKDVSRHHYHNKVFRDAALVSGLDCPAHDSRRGYQHTVLNGHGRRVVEAFEVDEECLTWPVGSPG
jgi:hypothetical protein